MKNQILIAITLLFTTFLFAQDNSNKGKLKKDEIKLNAGSTLAAQPEFVYEHVIDEESSYGVAVAFALDKDINTKFALTPYYRYFFGKKPAAGFFAEGFAMLNENEVLRKQYYYSYDYTYSQYETKFKFTDFALGVGIGSKWITKKGLIFEINFGVGRNLFNGAEKYDDSDKYKFVIRSGLNVGYRF